MFCTECGIKLLDGSLFCTNCGTKTLDVDNNNSTNKASKQSSNLIYEKFGTEVDEDADADADAEAKTKTDLLEITYFKNNFIFISNKKCRFTGFEGESLEKKNYEISAKLIKASYKKTVNYSNQFWVLFILFIIFCSSLASRRETPLSSLLLFIIIITFVYYYDKYLKENINPIKIAAKIDGTDRIFTIALPVSIENKEIDNILNGFSQEKADRTRKEWELEGERRKIEGERRKILADRTRKEWELEGERRKILSEKREAANLKKLKVAFMKSLNSTNLEINIPTIQFLSNHLENNQNFITQLKSSWIHDLVKIKSYLLQANVSIKSNYIQTLNEKNTDFFKKMQAEVISQIEAYDKIYGNSLILIDSIVDKNYVLSYEIYEIFDKLGFFESNWEKTLIKKFEDLTDSIDIVNSKISDINKKLELITNINISNMTEEVSKSELLSAPVSNGAWGEILSSALPFLGLYAGYKIGKR